MTYSLRARNPNEAFPITMNLLREEGVLLSSRNGPAIEYPDPVSVTYTHACERVLFNQKRNINPYLHFFEPFWILAGRRDVDFMSRIVSRFKDYSDDGKTFAAAYGYRLRRPLDQVAGAIRRLRRDPTDRRTVLMIRQPRDMPYTGKDAACNIAIACKIRNGRLNLHVFNRSNDAIWGGPAGGTNYPQFTILQEYMAGHIGCGIGTYTVTTDSMHVYPNPQWERNKDPVPGAVDFYATGHVKPFPLMAEPDKFEKDLRAVFDEGVDPEITEFSSIFFRNVYRPMWQSFIGYKKKDGSDIFCAEAVAASDWREVTTRWLTLNNSEILSEVFQ